MSAKNNPTSPPVYPDLVLTRVFDAPRELVFQLWTDPAHLAQWWGPHGFTNPRCEAVARPGGAIRIDMRGPDGTVYPMVGEFQEVIAPERLVFVSGLPRDQGDMLFKVLNTVTFVEHAGKTMLTLIARVIEAGDGAAKHLSGQKEGWAQTLERLAAHVAATRTGGKS